MALKLKRKTTAEWASENPVLEDGEPAVDMTLLRLKIGDGTTAWNSLPFVGRPLSAFAISLLDDADAAEGRASLELGSAAQATVGTGAGDVPTVTTVDAKVAVVVGSAPAPLDTLGELSDALGDDANFAATMTTALAGKAAASHTHAGVYEPVLGNPSTNGHILSSTTAGVRSWIAPPGGSDPWTTLRLASDFSINTTAAGDVTGMFFTPAANKRYEFYALLMTRTATATVGPRPGLAWPTGMSDGAATITQPSSATATLTLHGNISASMLTAVGGLPNNTQSYLAEIKGIVVAGGSPSGNLRVQLASETAGTNVTIKAGSFLRWREIP